MQDYEKRIIKKIYKISKLYRNGTLEQRVEVGKLMEGKSKIFVNYKCQVNHVNF